MDSDKPWLNCLGGDMKNIQVRMLRGLLIFVLPLTILVACGGGGSDGSSSSSSSNSGTVSIGLTDNQVGYNAVVLTIKEIGIVASNTATTYYNSTDLDNLPLTVNVLDYPGEQTLHLADIEVDLPENGDPVCFKQIRLVLAAEGDPDCTEEFCNYVVLIGDPTKHELKTPSGQQSGVKILTPNDFCVEDGNDTAQVTIDFDPVKAIVDNPNKYILKPTGIRIIEGSWSTAPDSFIDGLVAVPTYNSGALCDELEPAPEVTVTAYDQGTLNLATQTAALTEGPVTGAEMCTEWCAEDSDSGSCETACAADLLSECYYSGNFKLLLADMGRYDLEATWDNFSAAMPTVEYNSTVLLELTED
jgi:hypothetical protein